MSNKNDKSPRQVLFILEIRFSKQESSLIIIIGAKIKKAEKIWHFVNAYILKKAELVTSIFQIN